MVRGTRAELDAAYFHLYGIGRDDAAYILSTFTHTGFVPEQDRGPDGSPWAAGGIGEQVLAAYEALG